MDLVVDGLIFQNQAHGGISRIYQEILPRMCDKDDSLQVTVLTTLQSQARLPAHPRICHRRLFPIERVLRPGRIWSPVTMRIRADIESWIMDHGRRKLWHSTYYTRSQDWLGPEVVTVVDMIHERYPHFFGSRHEVAVKARKQDCIRNADAIICISETTRQDLCEYYGVDVERTRVIPLAHSPVFRQLDDTELDSREGQARSFLLYIGRREHYKNFDLLARAYSQWSGRSDVDLVTVGLPWSSEERQLLGALNIREKVHLLSQPNDEALTRLYNRAVALIYPSLYEGFGIPLLEAMACGCPIVASRIPTTIEVAGDYPFYFEPSQVESLISALDRILVEGRDAARIRFGCERAEQFSWDRTALQTLEVYYAVCDA